MKLQHRYLLLAVLAVTGVVGVAVGYRLWRDRVARSTAILRDEARRYADRGDHGEIDKAIQAYAHYMEYAGTRADDRVALAEYAALLGERACQPGSTNRQVSDAVPVLEDASRKNPDDHRLRLRLAEVLVRIRRYANAREHLEVMRQSSRDHGLLPAEPARGTGVVEKVPEHGGGGSTVERYDVELLFVKTLIGTGHFDEAAAVAADMIGFSLKSDRFVDVGVDADPSASVDSPSRSTVEVYQLLEGLLRDRLRKPEAAERVSERSVVANPTDASAWFYLAERMWAARDVPAALAAYAQVAKLSQDGPQRLLADIRILQADGKNAEVAAATIQARERYPDDAKILVAAVRFAESHADSEQALAILNDCIARRQVRPILLSLVVNMPITQDHIEALQSAVDALRALDGPAHPRTELAGLLEARLLSAQREWFLAAKTFRSVRPLVASLDPVKRKIDLFLAECLGEIGDYDEQLAMFERLANDRFFGLKAQIGVASALLSLGQHGRAIGVIQEVERAVDEMPKAKRQAMLLASDQLLRFRITAAASMPAGQQDWSGVENLIALRASDPRYRRDRLAVVQAEVFVAQDEPGKAIGVLRQAAEEALSSVPVQVALVALVFEHEGLEAAQNMVGKASPFVRRNADFMIVEARVAAGANGEKAAVMMTEIADRGLRLADPIDSARVLAALASLAQAGDMPDEAKRLWELAAQRHPNDLQASMGLLNLAKQENDSEQARLAAEVIGRLTGLDSPHYRYADAVTRVTAVLAGQAKSGSPGPKGSLSKADSQRLQEARLLLMEAENQRPGWQALQRLYADIDLLEGNTPEAIQRLQRAMQLGPQTAGLERQLTTLLKETGQPPVAVDLAQ